MKNDSPQDVSKPKPAKHIPHFLNVAPIKKSCSIPTPSAFATPKQPSAALTPVILPLCQPLARGLANVHPGVGEPRVFIQPVARGRATSLLHLRVAIGVDVELSNKTTGLVM